MAQPNKTERSMVPVVPNWWYYNSYTPNQRILFFGITRTVINFIIFILCVTFLSIYDYTTGVRTLLIILILLAVVHILVSLYFIYATKAGYHWIVKRWIICDITITVIFIISIIALICSMPENRVVIVLGIKLMLVSVWLCYRLSINNMMLMDPPFQVQQNV